MPLNIHIQWNAGTACVSECVLKTLGRRGLRVGPSKFTTVLAEKNGEIIHSALLQGSSCDNFGICLGTYLDLFRFTIRLHGQDI